MQCLILREEKHLWTLAQCRTNGDGWWFKSDQAQPSYPAKPQQRPVQFWCCRVCATWLVACTLSLGLRCNWQLSAVSLCPVDSNGATDGQCGIWVKIRGESRCHWPAISFAGALVPCQCCGFVLSLIRLTQSSQSQLDHLMRSTSVVLHWYVATQKWVAGQVWQGHGQQRKKKWLNILMDL